MRVKMNPAASSIVAGMLLRTQHALDAVVRDHSGHPVPQVRMALKHAWASSNPGAAITEPELTTVATLISKGKRVWLENDGRLMADD